MPLAGEKQAARRPHLRENLARLAPLARIAWSTWVVDPREA
jgi:hypothetical protein